MAPAPSKVRATRATNGLSSPRMCAGSNACYPASGWRRRTIRIVSRIELTAFLSDKGGGVLLSWRSGLNRRNLMSATNQPATMKGPAIFLAQFVGNAQPFNSFAAICGWAAGLGYKGVQVPTSDPRLIDIDKAAVSQTYCDEIAGVAEPRPGDHRIVHPPARTTRRCSSGLQRGLRCFRSGCSQGQAEGTSDLGDDQMKRRRRRPAASVSPAASALPARWPGPFFIHGRSGRGPDRYRVRRTRASLASDPRRL